jgi:hypothetical protein
MKLIDVTAKFKTDDDCLDYIEKMRWPDGQTAGRRSEVNC